MTNSREPSGRVSSETTLPYASTEPVGTSAKSSDGDFASVEAENDV